MFYITAERKFTELHKIYIPCKKKRKVLEDPYFVGIPLKGRIFTKQSTTVSRVFKTLIQSLGSSPYHFNWTSTSHMSTKMVIPPISLLPEQPNNSVLLTVPLELDSVSLVTSQNVDKF